MSALGKRFAGRTVVAGVEDELELGRGFAT
jgi:hypothetical protein